MDKDGILAWIRSFEGVTPENCPDFESLKDGIVLGIVFNEIQNTRVEFQMRELDKSKDDWVTALRNLRDLQSKVKPAFDAAKAPLKLDTSAVARGSRPEALVDLVESFVILALKGPKKADIIQKMKNLPKDAQKAIKAIVEKVKASPVRPTAPPKEAAPAPQPSPSSRAILLLERQIATAKEEKQKLAQQREELEKEKAQVLAERANVEKCPEQIEYEEACAKYEELEKRAKEIEEQVKAKEGVLEDKKRAQGELDAVDARIRDLKRRLNMSAPTVDSFRDSTDLTAQKYLKEIDEAEARLTDEYQKSIQAENQKIKAAAKKLVQEIKTLKEMVGDVGDEADDDGSKLADGIAELVERANRTNAETIEMIAKAEAIERLKQQRSFLEHLRSSTKYIKPE